MTYEFLPEPTCCDVCKGAVIYLKVDDRYNSKKSNGVVGLWKCRNIRCGAMVSCHPGTNKPVGYMASESVRKLRTKAHAAFDNLWCGECAVWSRVSAYFWLSQLLNIDKELANISKLNKEQLYTVIEQSKIMAQKLRVVDKEEKKSIRNGFRDKKSLQSKARNRKEKVKIGTRNYDSFIEV